MWWAEKGRGELSDIPEALNIYKDWGFAFVILHFSLLMHFDAFGPIAQRVETDFGWEAMNKFHQQRTTNWLIYVQFPGQSSPNAIRFYWFSIPPSRPHNFPSQCSPAETISRPLCRNGARKSTQRARSAVESPKNPTVDDDMERNKIVVSFSVADGASAPISQNVVPIESETLSDSSQY